MEHWTRRPLERTSRASEWRAGVGEVSTEAALSEVEEEGSWEIGYVESSQGWGLGGGETISIIF